MNPHEQLTEALTTERFGATSWWRKDADRTEPQTVDDDLTTARRRRTLDRAFRDNTPAREAQ